MCRKKQKRKVGKEQLALAVRKNFNAAAVSEVEVMVGLLYKVRHQGMSWCTNEIETEIGVGLADTCNADRAFRMRAAPATKPTKSGSNAQGQGQGQG